MPLEKYKAEFLKFSSYLKATPTQISMSLLNNFNSPNSSSEKASSQSLSCKAYPFNANSGKTIKSLELALTILIISFKFERFSLGEV